jgi:hypothetical protein
MCELLWTNELHFAAEISLNSSVIDENEKSELRKFINKDTLSLQAIKIIVKSNSSTFSLFSALKGSKVSFPSHKSRAVEVTHNKINCNKQYIHIFKTMRD